MSEVTLKQVVKAYGRNQVIHGIDLAIGSGEFVVFVEGTSDDPALRAAIEQQGVEFAGFIPADELIFEYDLNGKPLVQLPPGSKALTSYFSILDKLVP